MNNTLFKKVVIIIITCLGISLCFLCRDSFAVAPINSIKSKAAFEGVWQCLGEGAFLAEWTATKGGKGLMRNDGGNETVKLPYDWTDATDNNANCKQVLFGFHDNHRDDDKLNYGLIPGEIEDSKDKNVVAKFYAGTSLNGEDGLGYIAEKAGDVSEGQETQQVYFEVSTSDTMCRDEKGPLSRTFTYYDGDGNWTGNEIDIGDKLVFPTITKSTQGSSFSGNTPSILTEDVNVPPVGSEEIWFYSVCGFHFWITAFGDDLQPDYEIRWGSSSDTRDVTGLDGKWSTGSVVGKHTWYRSDNSTVDDKVTLIPKIVTGTIETGGGSEDFEDYKLIWKTELAYHLLQGINEKNQIGYSVPNLKNYNDLALTDKEIYDLYKYYLTDVYKGFVFCEGDGRYDLYGSYPDIKWKKGVNCKVYVDADSRGPNHSVYGVDSNKHFTKKLNSYQDVVDMLNTLDLDNIDIDDPEDPGPLEPEPGDDPAKEPTCASSGGAESLGWIVCPILSWMGRASNDLYNYYIEPALNVKPALFNEGSGENDDVKDAWGIFQNIANIVFVILFLIVIFSQLTGVGIDNYGIKKILPKLIIAAILVNISYYICLIFIDLSNIVGNGIQNMFNGMSSSLTINSAVIGGENIGSEILSTSVTGAVLLGALVVGGVAVWQNPAILLTLLISGLGVVISILFLFLILAAREAAIVVLTVISPLAFVCYILPNTKNLFDRWRKMGEGLLLVYPICGLLVGGGSYVSKLLLASGIGTGNDGNGFFGAFSAMLISVVPIFFIPTVLRSSFAAMGNLGAKISGFGQRLRGATTRGMRNTNTYKQMQERGLERRTRIRAGYDSEGNKKNLGALGRFMRGGRRNVQRESLRYQKMISDRGSLEATEGDDFMLTTETANEMKNIVASGEINDMGSMQRSLELALESGNRSKIRAYTDGLTAKGEDGRVAVKAAYNAAVRSGRMSTVSAQTFANNIMANHAADYKNNNRSMFEVARNINTAANTAALRAAASTTTSSYVGANNANLAGKVTATTIGNMDDDAFGEMFGGYNGNPVTIPAGASANEIGAAAYAALNDQNANIKAERRKYLEDLVKSSGYQAKVQNVQVTGGTVDTNVLNPVLNVQGTVDVGNEVDVNITQRRGGQVKPVQVGGTVDTQEAGIYADSAGNTYRIRKTLDGKYVDDAGFEVDISKLNPR